MVPREECLPEQIEIFVEESYDMESVDRLRCVDRVANVPNRFHDCSCAIMF